MDKGSFSSSAQRISIPKAFFPVLIFLTRSPLTSGSGLPLVRSQSKKIAVEGYRRFVDKATSFDFIEYGTRDTYQLTFHIVRFPISESTYECLVTWAELIAYNLTESIINHTAVVHQKKTMLGAIVSKMMGDS